MALILFALFLGIPLVEIALFITVGGWIGVIPTIAIVIATAIAGAWLVRHQGIGTLRRAQADIARNVIPTGPMAEGLAILVAGALLLTPGFLTDTIGFALLIPPVRRLIVARLGGWLAARATVIDMGGTVYRETRGGRDTVIDAEAVEIDDPDETPKTPRGEAPSPWRGR